MTEPSWLRPVLGPRGVSALMTTRQGGVGSGAYASLNLGGHVGDDPATVAENLRRVATACDATPVCLEQVHGATVVRLGEPDTLPGAPTSRADASITTDPGIACTVLVADCLPVLFTAPDGRAVGAAHAGWRGLAQGVLEATVGALCEAAHCEPEALSAWMGACIGPSRFEVGPDVLYAFDATSASPGRRFVPGAPGKWFADLPGLASDRLRAAGLRAISGAGSCTVSDPSRFFSYRRDRVTGRMAALVWIDRR